MPCWICHSRGVYNRLLRCQSRFQAPVSALRSPNPDRLSSPAFSSMQFQVDLVQLRAYPVSKRLGVKLPCESFCLPSPSFASCSPRINSPLPNRQVSSREPSSFSSSASSCSLPGRSFHNIEKSVLSHRRWKVKRKTMRKSW